MATQPLGRPAIATPNRLDVRAVQGAVEAARQRIEALERAVVALQGLVGSATDLSSLQQQLAALALATGTVTRVDASVPSILTVSGVPITVQGTIALALASQSARRVFASPLSAAGVPSFQDFADVFAVQWRDVAADTVLTAADAGNAISTSGNSGVQYITVPGEDVDIPVGSAVLLAQYGGATVSVVTVSGVALNYRSGLSADLAGEFAAATLIKRAADSWLLCGDLAAA